MDMNKAACFMPVLPEFVTHALDLLHSAGFEAYTVGGAVRDSLLGLPVSDWDITTNALPEETKSVFSSFRLIETGLRHGTVTVLLDGNPLEITTYRIDGEYSDCRRPDSVRFTSSLVRDLSRRDFTCNAMAYEPLSGLIDPFGGRADLEAGIIRCVSEPAQRFREDALRILRALRFASVFGMKIEKTTAFEIHENKELLSGVSPERIHSELQKLLCGRAAAEVLREFADAIAVPVPEIAPMFGFEQRSPYHCHDVWEHTLAFLTAIRPDASLRWAALFHDIGKPAAFTCGDDGVGHFIGHEKLSCVIADGVMQRLHFDGKTRQNVLFLVENHMKQIPLNEKSVKRAMGKFGAERLLLLIEMFMADTFAQSEDCRRRIAGYEKMRSLVFEILDSSACFSVRDLDCSGYDIMELGYSGKAVGKALSALVSAVINGSVENKKESLLHYLKSSPL